MEVSNIPLLIGKFEDDFIKLNKFDGGYGTLHVCEEKSTGLKYAIKEIYFTNPTQSEKEVEIMIKVQSEFTVRFITSWKSRNFVYIQMELCSGNLEDVLQKIPRAFPRDGNNRMSSLEYFVCMELLKELTEGLNYLHNLKPKIMMHRDLKPLNVLFTTGENNRFLKICDFGLAKEFQQSSNSSKITNGRFVAWEVDIGGKYNYKSDIFSLCIIAMDIFRFYLRSKEFPFERDDYLSTCLNPLFETKATDMITTLQHSIDKDTQNNYKQRPTSQEFLNKIINDWSIDSEAVIRDEDFTKNYEKLISSENEFLIEFTKIKLGL